MYISTLPPHGILEKHALQDSFCSIIASGATDVVKLLLKHGADPQATCNEGKTPFDQARTSPEIRLLLHKANRDADSSAAKRAASCANCGTSISDYCIFFIKLPHLGCSVPVVSTLDSRLSASGSTPGQGNCIVFLGKTLIISLSVPLFQMGTGKFR